LSKASQKGSSFERLIADHLKERLRDDRIDRRVKRGQKDTGDIAGVLSPFGGRVVIEAKNHARMDLAHWVDEAETERGNDDAVVGVVVHKRRGKGQPGDQYVSMTVDTLVHLLGGPAEGMP